MKTLLVSTAVLLLFAMSSYASSTKQGTIQSIDLENRIYTIKEAKTGKIHVIDLEDSTKTRLDKRDLAALQRLSVGDSVKYKVQTDETKRAPSRVAGTIVSVDLQNNLYTVQQTKTGALHTFKFKDSTTIRNGDRVHGNLASLRVGDNVVYKKKIKKPATDTIAATVKDIDAANKKLVIVDPESGGDKAVSYTAKASQSSAFKDLQAGQKVVLEVTSP